MPGCEGVGQPPDERPPGMTGSYPRDLTGYGPKPPQAAWPGGARIAINFVLNYEEGAERSVLHGDDESESFLSEMVGAVPIVGARHMSMESLYEYGSRVGVWRILNLFERYEMPLTIFAVAMAAERNPAVIQAMVDAGHLRPDTDVAWLASSTLASVQGGLVLSQARRDPLALRRALDGALALIATCRVTG